MRYKFGLLDRLLVCTRSFAVCILSGASLSISVQAADPGVRVNPMYHVGNDGSDKLKCNGNNTSGPNTIELEGRTLVRPEPCAKHHIKSVPEIATGHNGLAVLAYVHDESKNHNGTGPYKIKVAFCKSLKCDSVSFVVLSEGADSRRISLAINSSGFPVVAFADMDSRLRVATCHDVECGSFQVSGPLASISINSNIGPALTFNAIGFPFLAIPRAAQAFTFEDQFPRFVECRDEFCNSAIVGGLPNSVNDGITATNSEEAGALLAYNRFIGGQFLLSVRSCSVIVSETQCTDSLLGRGFGSFKGLKKSGNLPPFLTYWDLVNVPLPTGDKRITLLRGARCIDKACSEAVYITNLEPDPVNESSSSVLALDAESRPFVLYHKPTDTANNTLYVAYCEDPGCAKVKRARIGDDTGVNPAHIRANSTFVFEVQDGAKVESPVLVLIYDGDLAVLLLNGSSLQ